MIRPARCPSAIVLAVALLAACAGSTDDGSPTTTTSAPPETTVTPEPVRGVVADIGTNRLYAVHRAFGLGLRNVDDHPIVIQSMQLHTPEFEPLPSTDREVTLAPGRRLVLPLPYGEARCDGEPGPTFGVVLVVGGEAVRFDAPEEYAGAVARLHQRECAAADVLDRVDITFGDAWTQDGITISGELRLEQRRPGEPVAIDDAVGNVIFTLILEEAHPVLRVSDDEPTAEVPVVVSADRCDPHAVAEFKTPYLFLAWVAVGDAEPVPVPLELTGGARRALQDLIASCST